MSRHALSSRPRPAPPTTRSCGRGYLFVEYATDPPHKAGQFAGDRGECFVRADPCTQMAIAVVETQLRTPGQFDDGWRYLELALLECGSNARGVPSVMRGLAKDVAQHAIPCSGDRTAVLLAAAGAFRRDGTDVGHELGCGREAVQVASFGHDADGTQKANAAKRLQGANEGQVVTRLRTLVQGGLQTLDTFTGRGDFCQVVR